MMIFLFIYLAGILIVAFSVCFILLIDNYIESEVNWWGRTLFVSLGVLELRMPFFGDGYAISQSKVITLIFLYPLIIFSAILFGIVTLVFTPFDKLARFIASKIK